MKSHLWPTLAVLLVGLTSGWSVRGIANPNETARPASLLVAQDSLVKSQESDALAGPDSPLATLDWLVGEWEGGGERGRVEFNCRFTKNNAFLIRSFRIVKETGEAETAMSGMQVIAWDPVEQTIRSWTFDSDGGFGEDRWSQSGERYIARSKYTLPDGGVGASLNSMTYVDDKTFVWQSAHRELDGELLPDGPKVVIRKVVPRNEESRSPSSGGEK